MLGRKRHRPIPCLSCGYDITGLARDGVCPECAYPLKDTLEASTLLRGCPLPMVRRFRLGTLFMAWAATAPIAGIPAGSIIGMVWAVMPGRLGEMAWLGLVAGVILGLVASALCFAIGAVLLTKPSPARPLRPKWAGVMLRVTGPAAALLTPASAALSWARVDLGPLETGVVRAMCQGLVLAALVSFLRVCAAIERQTQTEWKRPHVFGWVVLGLLAAIWGYFYWLGPLIRESFGRERNGEWGAGWALAALVLQFAILWRIAESVSLEASIARLTQNSAADPQNPD